MSEQAPASAAPEPPVARSGWQLLRFRGIPVRADPSALILLLLGVYFFQGSFSQLGTSQMVAATIAASLLLFLSVLGHEFGHLLASLAVGVRVAGITLFAMGGATETEQADSPGKEFLIVAGGPAVSFALAGLFSIAAELSGSLMISLICIVMAIANLALGIFNVVPAYPLDGGRLLRAVIWGVTRNPNLATLVTARIGQGFAALLILGAVVGYAGLAPPQLQRGIAGFIFRPSLFQIFIGFFLYRGAKDAYDRAVVRGRLGRRSVAEVMGSVPPPLSPALSLDDAALQMQGRPSVLWPVGNPVIGALLLAQIEEVPPDERGARTVGDLAVPAQAAAVDIGTPLGEAVAVMVDGPGQMVIVTQHGAALGLLSPSLVADVLA